MERRYYSYEDLAVAHERRQGERLEEYLAGSDVVQWYSRIERQLVDKISHEESSRNTAHADKLRAFLKVWRDHEIRGSLNREPIDVLKAAAEVLSVDSWSLSSYFSSLTSSLRQLTAKIEELPYDQLGAAQEPQPDLKGGGRIPSSFGPEEDAPPPEDLAPGEAGPEDAGDQEDDEKAAGEPVQGGAAPQNARIVAPTPR